MKFSDVYIFNNKALTKNEIVKLYEYLKNTEAIKQQLNSLKKKIEKDEYNFIKNLGGERWILKL